MNQIARTHFAQVETKLTQLRALQRELTRLVRASDEDSQIRDRSLLGALNGDG